MLDIPYGFLLEMLLIFYIIIIQLCKERAMFSKMAISTKKR